MSIPLLISDAQPRRMSFFATVQWIAACASRPVCIAALHVPIFVGAYAVAFVLRFEGEIPTWMTATFWTTLPFLLAIKLCVFYQQRQFTAWWGYVSFRESISLARATAFSWGCLALANAAGSLPAYVPRIVLVLDAIATVLVIAAVRAASRLLHERLKLSCPPSMMRRALLVGASNPDKVLSLHLQCHPELPFKICGFLDRSVRKAQQSFGGVPLLGSISQLAAIAREYATTDVIAIAGCLPGRELRQLREQCETAGLRLHIIPPLCQLIDGQKQLSLKPVDITSLLRREPVQLDHNVVDQYVKNAVVLVTGSGGSIGSELCKQMLSCRPRKLVLVDRSEPSLYQIDMELRRMGTSIEIEPCLGDINDEPRMRSIFERTAPGVVFHVAAHKHVPLLETHVGEAVKNNVLGTAKLVDLSHECGVDRFVYISTDKAVNPSSIMGVSKHLAEKYVLAMAEEYEACYVAVRFGNVLGSVGSVVPLFEEQIRQGGPLTITHPEMRRFFMTIAEAAKLVLQAGALGKGGEIFVLDMGEPIRVVDLARDMVRMTGLPDHAIDMTFVGMRPGEKLYEELYFDDEEQLQTPHPKLFSARHRPISLHQMLKHIEELKSLVDRDEVQLVEKLKQLVPEYIPPATVSQKLPIPTESADLGLVLQAREGTLGPLSSTISLP